MSYLLDEYEAKSLKTYNRVGNHLIGFLRQHVQHPLFLPRPLNLRVKQENLQMPSASIEELDLFVRAQLSRLMSAQYKKRVRQRLSKLFGKCPQLANSVLFVCLCTAIFVLLHTGCRPKEAAHIVFDRSI